MINKRLILPAKFKGSLIAVPSDAELDELELSGHEQMRRHKAVVKGNYADPECGAAETYDPSGDYLCNGSNGCNQQEGPECLLISEIKAKSIDISKGAPGCGKYEVIRASDPEMRMPVVGIDIAQSGFEFSAEGGFGCKRCPHGTKGVKSDGSSLKRNIWCGGWGCRVTANACCDLNGVKTVPLTQITSNREQGGKYAPTRPSFKGPGLLKRMGKSR